MHSSQRLRLKDMRGVYRLVGECGELWADPNAWQAHLLHGAAVLTGAHVGVVLELRGVAPERQPEILDAADRGWCDEASRRHYVYGMADRGVDLQPSYPALARAFRGRKCVTFLRNQLITDAAWYRSEMYNDCTRPAHTDHYLVSLHALPALGAAHLFNVNRMLHERPLDRREQRVLHLLHLSIAPMIGTRLATWRHRGLHMLSPRQRQTLERLLEGDSEKQIALRLGLRRSTVHEYVTALHRHFDVASRGELLAYFLRRRPEPHAHAQPPGPPSNTRGG